MIAPASCTIPNEMAHVIAILSVLGAAVVLIFIVAFVSDCRRQERIARRELIRSLNGGGR